MKYVQRNRGTTLIEAIIYLALLGILMGGAVIAAFNLFEAGGRAQTRVLLQDEGEFMFGKIEWLLKGAEHVEMPLANTSDSTLVVERWDDEDVFSVTREDASLTYATGTSPGIRLNNSNVEVRDILFTRIKEDVSDSVRVSFTLAARTPNGQEIIQSFPTTTIFLR